MGIYKRYVVRNGKIFGPYLYEQKQVNGKRVYRYIGKTPAYEKPMAEQKQSIGLWDRIRSWF